MPVKETPIGSGRGRRDEYVHVRQPVLLQNAVRTGTENTILRTLAGHCRSTRRLKKEEKPMDPETPEFKKYRKEEKP